jgi:hypothetical protein
MIQAPPLPTTPIPDIAAPQNFPARQYFRFFSRQMVELLAVGVGVAAFGVAIQGQRKINEQNKTIDVLTTKLSKLKIDLTDQIKYQQTEIQAFRETFDTHIHGLTSHHSCSEAIGTASCLATVIPNTPAQTQEFFTLWSQDLATHTHKPTQQGYIKDVSVLENIKDAETLNAYMEFHAGNIAKRSVGLLFFNNHISGGIGILPPETQRIYAEAIVEAGNEQLSKSLTDYEARSIAGKKWLKMTGF